MLGVEGWCTTNSALQELAVGAIIFNEEGGHKVSLWAELSNVKNCSHTFECIAFLSRLMWRDGVSGGAVHTPTAHARVSCWPRKTLANCCSPAPFLPCKADAVSVCY